MSDLTPIDATVLFAAALGAHRLHASMNVCGCRNWRPQASRSAGSLAEQHEQHVAAEVTALAGVLAKAARDDEREQVKTAVLAALDSDDIDWWDSPAGDIERAVRGVFE